MTYEELTADLPEKIANAFILSPGYIGADSLDLERFIETVWKAPVTMENYKAVAQSFRQWYKETNPDEYHDPPPEFPGVGGGWGGERKGAGRPFGIPNPNGGRKTNNPAGHTVARNVTLDPDIFQLVLWHANARGNTFSASVNMLLREALRNHEVDAEANEVL